MTYSLTPPLRYERMALRKVNCTLYGRAQLQVTFYGTRNSVFINLLTKAVDCEFDNFTNGLL
jgi:hypothetical protein